MTSIILRENTIDNIRIELNVKSGSTLQKSIAYWSMMERLYHKTYNERGLSLKIRMENIASRTYQILKNHKMASKISQSLRDDAVSASLLSDAMANISIRKYDGTICRFDDTTAAKLYASQTIRNILRLTLGSQPLDSEAKEDIIAALAVRIATHVTDSTTEHLPEEKQFSVENLKTAAINAKAAAELYQELTVLIEAL